MFTLPDLPYDYNALEPYIDEQTMKLHHDKHHATYVQNLNDVLKGQEQFFNMDIYELMMNLDRVPEELRKKVTDNGGGHANHSFFWQIMSPGKRGDPSGKLLEAIKQQFSDFKTFQEQFKQAALGVFGSGWAWLIVDQGELKIITTPNQDNPWMECKTPILGIDVWEHAYYLKYQNRRAEYIDNWWNVINWDEVAKRLEQ